MCITMHGSEDVQGVFNYEVCLMAMYLVKQGVYSNELQKLYCSCESGMVMAILVTVYNKAGVCSTELQKLCCSCVPDMITVTVL
jgi:hypothetical protein